MNQQQVIYPQRIHSETDYKKEAEEHDFQNVNELARARVKIKKKLRALDIQFDNQDAFSHLKNLLEAASNRYDTITHAAIIIEDGRIEMVSWDDVIAAAEYYDRLVKS